MLTGISAFVLGSVVAMPPASWPQWHRPARDGVAVGGPQWPDRLTDAVSRRWRVEALGPSYSGPIVAGDRVFTTATRDKASEVVRALDRETGKELWRTEWEGSMSVPFFAGRNGSWIRATPACNGDRLYVAGMRDVLVCLDAATGVVAWKVDFAERFETPVPAFGFVCSPLVDGDAVYAQAGGGLVRLDAGSGDVVWRALDDGGGMNSAFASPVLATLAGRRQLVVQTRQKLCGVAVDTGAVLWEQPIKSFRGMNILTPTVVGDRVFTAAYGGRAHLFEIKAADDALTAAEVWQFGVQGNMTSPVVLDGSIFLLTRSNRFICLDLAEGAERWTSGPTGDQYWSLVARDDRILALADSGRLRLIRAAPAAYEVIDEIEVASSDSWAHLAVAGRDLFVREADALSAWRWGE